MPDVDAIRRNARFYLVGTLVGRASGLVLIPLYILLLSREEAGAWAVLGALRTLIMAVGTFALDGLITQEYWRRPEGERAAFASALIMTTLRWNLAPALVMVGIICWWPTATWALVVLGAQASAVVVVWLSSLRIEERAGAYCALICATGGGGALLAACFVWFGWGVHGLALGFALPPLLVLPFVVRRRGTAAADVGMSAYVVRVLPGRAIAELAGQADRFVLAFLLTDAVLGLYDLAMRCAGAVGMLLSSAKQAVLPAVLRALAGSTTAQPAWSEWRRACWLAGGGAVLFVIVGEVAATLVPAHRWSGAVAFLPGAMAVPLWMHAGLGNAAAIYHHRLIAAQAWLPSLSLIGVLSATTIGAQLSYTVVPWAVAAAQATIVVLTSIWLRRRGHGVANRGELLPAITASLVLAVIAIAMVLKH
ncbi:MAG: hypothetical protein AAB263_10565 [Planctomycetota bacterium]